MGRLRVSVELEVDTVDDARRWLSELAVKLPVGYDVPFDECVEEDGAVLRVRVEERRD